MIKNERPTSCIVHLANSANFKGDTAIKLCKVQVCASNCQTTPCA